jgi:hypothetical protein
MNCNCVVKFFVAAVALAAVGRVDQAKAAFIIPDGATSPFEAWSRSTPNSMYAEWNTFTVPNGGTNNPDVGQYGPATATIANQGAAAILTGGGNIYSFSGATDFDLSIPNYGYGAAYTTRVVVQMLTQGNPLDGSTVRLTYNPGSGNQTILPTQTVAPGVNPEWLFAWDLPSFNPASMLVEFAASTSSMSLDRVVVDTFTQSVPEPASVLLMGLAVGAVVAKSRRRDAAWL